MLREKEPDIKNFPTRRCELAKRYMQGDEIFPSILTGAVQTPACFQGSGNFPTKCIACGELGHHDHIFRDCVAVRKKWGPRPVCLDSLQRRYGWPCGKDAHHDQAVLEWMKKVTKEIWDARYGNAHKEHMKQQAMKRKCELKTKNLDKDQEEDFRFDDRDAWLLRKAAFEGDSSADNFGTDSESEKEELD